MTTPWEVEPLECLSISACQALGAVAFRRWCARHDLVHAELDAFVEHAFSLAEAPDLVAWERDMPALVAVGLGDDLPEELAGVYEDCRSQIFLALVQHVTEIGYANMYCGRTPAPWRHLHAVLAILDEEGMGRPDVTPFLVSSSSERDGWGEPLAPEVMAVWREVR